MLWPDRSGPDGPGGAGLLEDRGDLVKALAARVLEGRNAVRVGEVNIRSGVHEKAHDLGCARGRPRRG